MTIDGKFKYALTLYESYFKNCFCNNYFIDTHYKAK